MERRRPLQRLANGGHYAPPLAACAGGACHNRSGHRDIDLGCRTQSQPRQAQRSLLRFVGGKPREMDLLGIGARSRAPPPQLQSASRSCAQTRTKSLLRMKDGQTSSLKHADKPLGTSTPEAPEESPFPPAAPAARKQRPYAPPLAVRAGGACHNRSGHRDIDLGC